MSALDFNDLEVEQKYLFVPPINDVIDVLNQGLAKYFKDISVTHTECPNLSKAPFNLTSPGLGGSPTLVEYGGVQNLQPLPTKSKIYDLKHLSHLTKIKPTFAVGAGAGSFKFAKTNCEGIFDITIDGEDSIRNETRCAKVTNRETVEVVHPGSHDTTFALLASFYCCQGLEGKVIQIKASFRLGPDDFVTSIRTVLASHYKDKSVGLGGVFLIENAAANHHIMPDFSTAPLDSDEKLNQWLVFKDLSPPLVSVGTLISSAVEGLNLRLQHFHSFNDKNQGGHYHFDVDAEKVSYTAYLNLASTIYRVDK